MERPSRPRSLNRFGASGLALGLRVCFGSRVAALDQRGLSGLLGMDQGFRGGGGIVGFSRPRRIRD